MPITINGSGTISGLSAGGLPDASVAAADLASSLDLSGKTVTLPAGTGGKLVNVAQVTIDSTATQSAPSSYARFPEMDASYTTTVAGKIFVSFSWALMNAGGSADTGIKLFRKIGSGTATEILVNPSPKSGSVSGVFPNYRGSQPHEGDRITYSFLDTPGHTAGDVITYEHHFKAQNDTILNVPRQTNGFTTTCVSTIVFMEVTS